MVEIAGSGSYQKMSVPLIFNHMCYCMTEIVLGRQSCCHYLPLVTSGGYRM